MESFILSFMAFFIMDSILSASDGGEQDEKGLRGRDRFFLFPCRTTFHSSPEPELSESSNVPSTCFPIPPPVAPSVCIPILSDTGFLDAEFALSKSSGKALLVAWEGIKTLFFWTRGLLLAEYPAFASKSKSKSQDGVGDGVIIRFSPLVSKISKYFPASPSVLEIRTSVDGVGVTDRDVGPVGGPVGWREVGGRLWGVSRGREG